MREAELGVSKAARLARTLLEIGLSRLVPGAMPARVASDLEREITASGGVPVLKGYRSAGQQHAGVSPFPACVCIGLDDQIVNAVPGDEPLPETGIVSLDLAVSLEGWHADVARSKALTPTQADQGLLDRLDGAMDVWLSTPFAGRRPVDVRELAMNAAASQGLMLLPEHLGHGIGRRLHERPTIPGPGLTCTDLDPLNAGLVLAVELTAVQRSGFVRMSTDVDGWTRRVYPAQRAAHLEHTIVLEHGRNRVLGVSERPTRDPAPHRA